MKLSKTFALIASVALCGAAAMKASAANTVDMAFVNVSPGVTVSINTPGTTGYFNTTAGQFNFNVSNQNPSSIVSALIPGPTLKTFCIDVDQGVTTSNRTYTVLGPGLGSYVLPYDNSADLQLLFNMFYGGVGNDATKLAGFQVAIWEVVNDAPQSLTSGDFLAKSTGSSSSTNAITQANYYLTHLHDGGATDSYSIYQLHETYKQDQVFAIKNVSNIPNIDIPAVPLPAALPSGAALLAGIGVIRKLRRRSVGA